MSRARLLPLALLLAAPALAHFGIFLPERPWPARGEPCRLTWELGHPYEGERSAAPRPEAVEAWTPSGERLDLTAAVVPVEGAAPARWALSFTPAERGDYVLRLRARHAEGAEEVRDLVKQVLHVPAVQRGWDRALGDPLELVPLTRPYGLEAGSTCRVQLLGQGQPLAGVLVEVEPLLEAPPPDLPPEPFVTRAEKTDALGQVVVSLPREGWWILAARSGDTRASLWVHVGR